MQKFFTGDRVRYVGKSRSWDKDNIMIIRDCRYNGNGLFSYSTTSGAWYKDIEFTLVERANEETFKQLDRFLDAEYED